jgi:initiation factor 1A
MPNLRGGKGYKKFKKSGNDDEAVFLQIEQGQFVGNITKLLGNLNANVYCQDNKTRICKIADGIKKKIKFYVGDVVLISFRDCLLSKTDLAAGLHSDRGDILGKFNPEQYSQLRESGVNPHLFRQTDILNSMSEKFEKGDFKGAEAIAQSSNNDDLFDFGSDNDSEPESENKAAAEPGNTYVTKPKIDWKTQRALGKQISAPSGAEEIKCKDDEGSYNDKDISLDDL